MENSRAQALTSQDESFRLAQDRTYQDVVAQLEYEGYLIDDISRTLLGRIRIVAHSTTHSREIVLSRSTGEILSDRIFGAVADGSGPNQGDAPGAVSFGGKVTVGVNSNGAGDTSGKADLEIEIGIGN